MLEFNYFRIVIGVFVFFKKIVAYHVETAKVIDNREFLQMVENTERFNCRGDIRFCGHYSSVNWAMSYIVSS